LGPRAGLDVMAKRKIPVPYRESKPGLPARSLRPSRTDSSFEVSVGPHRNGVHL